MAPKLTAKDFKQPLLKVLHSMTDGKPNRPIEHKDVYEPICTMMGIKVDQFGDNPATNTPWVIRWVQWALAELVDEGRAKRVGRGQWALTQAGVDHMDKTDLTTPVTPVSTPDPDPTGHADTGVSLKIGGGNPVESYHKDPYVRGLAIQGTKCFGSYAAQSSLCSSCPVNSECMNAMYSTLTQLAKNLEAEDKKAAEAAKRPPAPATTVKQTTPAPAATPVKKPPATVGVADTIKLLQIAKCTHCQKDIPKGTLAPWVKSSTDVSAGVYHPECYDQLVKGQQVK